MARTTANKMKRMIAEGIQKNRKQLFEWHLDYVRKVPLPFYCSVDLRDSGHKIVPVDSNLYPAGFNNICPEDLRAAPPLVRSFVESLAAGWKKDVPSKVLVIPERHTTNANYIENIYYLHKIFTDAGFDIRIGWWGPVPEGTPPGEPIKLLSATQKEVLAYPTRIEEGYVLTSDGYHADILVLNNDFSSGYPKELDQVKQPVLPSHRLGWHSRKKSEHFVHYNRLAAEFASIIGIDPWMIQIDTEEAGPVNFNENEGIDGVIQATDRILTRTRAAYEKYGVKQEPFVFIKNNAGTYGMGIMVVHSIEELQKMNRRTKNKMSVGKGSIPIQSVAVQEGIPTATLVDRLAAEPVIYLVGCNLIGGFLRTNTERGAEENLNSQGMVFKKLCMSDLRRASISDPGSPGAEDEEIDEPGEEPMLELVYGSIARISCMATGFELSRILGN